MKTFYGNKFKDQCSLDLAQIDLTPPPKRAPWYAPILRAFRITVVSSVALLPPSAGATPWTDENGNPNPDCTGSCHETGIPNPPEPPKPEPKPEPKQSHEGEPTGVMQCGCGYVVILREGVSKAAAKRACEAAVPVKARCSND